MIVRSTGGSIRRVIQSLALAIVVWGVVSAASFGLWVVWATNFSPEVPADYPFAYITNHAMERAGQLTHAEAERRINQAWQVGFDWATERARVPLEASPVAIPILAVLFDRRRARRPSGRGRRADGGSPRAPRGIEPQKREEGAPRLDDTRSGDRRSMP